jgi:hypothetical protein
MTLWGANAATDPNGQETRHRCGLVIGFRVKADGGHRPLSAIAPSGVQSPGRNSPVLSRIDSSADISVRTPSHERLQSGQKKADALNVDFAPTVATSETLLPFALPRDLDTRFGRIMVEMWTFDGSVSFRRPATRNRVTRSTEVKFVPFVPLADMVFPTSPSALSL